MQDFTYQLVKIDEYFDKIFYINMKKDQYRNEKMLEQFQKFGISNFERVEGAELIRFPQESHYRNFNKKDEKYIRGSLGCRESHIECIRRSKSRGYRRILILEDDIIFLQDPNLLLTQNHEILNDWDLLYFSGIVEPFFRNQIVCAHAYAIKSTLYDDILNMAVSSGMEIDNFYAKVLQHMSYNYNQSGKYNIRVILPFNQIIQDKSYDSNIQTPNT